MALLADDSANAESHLGATGLGTSSATFTMPSAVAVKVESVVATVNNAAGGDNTAKLTIADSSGEVIATRRQGETIPAGDTGTATFALRLAGASGASSLSHPIGFYNVAPNAGNPVAGGVNIGNLKFTFAGAGGGTDLLDTTVNGSPTGPAVKTSGMYAILYRVGIDPNPFGPWAAGSIGQLDLFVQNEPPPEDFFSQQATVKYPLDNVVGGSEMSGGWTRYLNAAPNPSTGQQFFQLGAARPLAIQCDVIGTVSVQRIY